MKFYLNGEEKDVSETQTLQTLLENLGYSKGTFALALNGKFVPRQEYELLILQPGDKLDVVSPMQGG